jgi:hypothetical protein
MQWIKNIYAGLFLTAFLSGCSSITHAVGDEIFTPSLGKGAIFMENIDNDEFLNFVLENNIIDGLKREDVIYVDNALTSNTRNPLSSSKLILAKEAFYEIESVRIKSRYWQDRTLDIAALKKEYQILKSGNTAKTYWTIPIYKRYYITPRYTTKAEIRLEDFFLNYCGRSEAYSSCETLYLLEEARSERQWHHKKRWYRWEEVPHRFNDIYKIKAVFDERIAYFLSLENNQTNINTR